MKRFAHVLLALTFLGCDEPPNEEGAPASSESAEAEGDEVAAIAPVIPVDSTARPDENSDGLVLRRPALPADLESFHEAHEAPEPELWATAFQYAAPVFENAAPGADTIGEVRRSTAIPITDRVFGAGCAGRWYEVDGGYICTREGFSVSESVGEYDQLLPELGQLMPYRYAAVTRRDGAPRYFRVPTEAEARAVSRGGEHEVLQQRLVGDYFVALDREEDGWQRSVRGRYIQTSELEERTTPLLVGTHVNEALPLPVAFVYGETRRVFRIEDGEASEVGTAETYARFHVERLETIAGAEYAVGQDGLAIRRDEVRLARRSAPDEAIRSHKWIHVDLNEQTLVAYERGEPIYATLVASGAEGYDTPRGVFRIRKKYITTTMDGTDPDDGDFEVEEVPWTMFYWRSFALHGAYWHDAFGAVRSHGCTNLAPADARWLFAWTTPEVPEGWHAYFGGEGTTVWLSRDDAEYDVASNDDEDSDDLHDSSDTTD